MSYKTSPKYVENGTVTARALNNPAFAPGEITIKADRFGVFSFVKSDDYGKVVPDSQAFQTTLYLTDHFLYLRGWKTGDKYCNCPPYRLRITGTDQSHSWHLAAAEPQPVWRNLFYRVGTLKRQASRAWRNWWAK